MPVRPQRPRPVTRPGRGPCILYACDTRSLWDEPLAGQVSCDPWPFSLAWGDKPNALDVGEPGFIRRRRKPDHAGSNPAIQTLKRKGKPTGDGTRLLPGRALR